MTEVVDGAQQIKMTRDGGARHHDHDVMAPLATREDQSRGAAACFHALGPCFNESRYMSGRYINTWNPEREEIGEKGLGTAPGVQAVQYQSRIQRGSTAKNNSNNTDNVNNNDNSGGGGGRVRQQAQPCMPWELATASRLVLLLLLDREGGRLQSRGQGDLRSSKR